MMYDVKEFLKKFFSSRLFVVAAVFTILFAIYKFVTYKRASDFFHKLFKSEENTIENKKSDHIDFDFSDKDDKK